MNSRVALITMLLGAAQGAALVANPANKQVSPSAPNALAAEQVYVQPHNSHNLARLLGIPELSENLSMYSKPVSLRAADSAIRDSFDLTHSQFYVQAASLVDSHEKGFSIESSLKMNPEQLTLIIDPARFDAAAFNAIPQSVWKKFGTVLVDVNFENELSPSILALMDFLDRSDIQFDLKFGFKEAPRLYYLFDSVTFEQIMARARKIESIQLDMFLIQSWVPFADKTSRVELDGRDFLLFGNPNFEIQILLDLKKQHKFRLVANVGNIHGESIAFLNLERVVSSEDLDIFDEINALEVDFFVSRFLYGVFASDYDYHLKYHLISHLTSVKQVALSSASTSEDLQFIQGHSQKWISTVEGVRIYSEVAEYVGAPLPDYLNQVKDLSFDYDISRSTTSCRNGCSADLSSIIPGLTNLITLNLNVIRRQSPADTPVLTLPERVSISNIFAFDRGRFYERISMILRNGVQISRNVTFTAKHLVLDGIEFSDKIHFEGNTSIELGILEEDQVELLLRKLPLKLESLTVRDEHIADLIRVQEGTALEVIVKQ